MPVSKSGYLEQVVAVYSLRRSRDSSPNGVTRVVLDSGEALHAENQNDVKEVMSLAERYGVTLVLDYDPTTLNLESIGLVSVSTVRAVTMGEERWTILLDDAQPAITVSRQAAQALDVDAASLIGRSIRFSRDADGGATVLALLPPVDEPQLDSPATRPVSCSTISPSQAQELFGQLCKATALADDWMPQVAFQFPRNYCWARAHLTSHIAATMGVETLKVWLFPPKGATAFNVATPNDPRGYVQWQFHVASAAQTDDGRVFVFDPALFDTAVPEEQWCSVQNTGGICQKTSRDIYKRHDRLMITDPDLRKTRADLAEALVALKLQQLRHGRPPYTRATPP